MKKTLLGKTPDGISVYEVDGAEVRNKLDVEFALGTHWLVKKYVPKNEAWVEALPNPRDQCFNIDHEIYEPRRMLWKGWSYNKTHKAASKHEARMRETGECRLVWGES